MSSFRPDIWRLQANGDIQGLIQALDAEDSALRLRSAAALRTLGAVEAIPALKRILDTEPDSETRSSILLALASLEMAVRGAEAESVSVNARPSPYSQAIETLVIQLSSSEPKLVVTAALKLAKLKDMRAVEALVMQFNNSAVPAKARLLIAEALLELDSAPGDVAVLGALRHTKPSIRRSAAAVLGQMRADWAVDPLSVALQDEDPAVREAAYTALQEIDTTDAISALAAYQRTRGGGSTTATIVMAALDIDDEEETTEAPAVTPGPAFAGPRDGLLRYMKSADAAGDVIAADAEPLTADQRGRLIIDPQTPSDDSSNENLQKLSWPKRDTSPHQHISTRPTQPLDPRRLEEAKDRLEGHGTQSE